MVAEGYYAVKGLASRFDLAPYPIIESVCALAPKQARQNGHERTGSQTELSMYIPPEFLITDSRVIASFLGQHSFGQMTAVLPSGKLAASHLPFVVTDEAGTLQFQTHLANENELSQLPDDSEVLLVFTGEHGYVSSSWYGHPNVPTWNYQVVHVYGTLQKQTQEELYTQLKTLTRLHEETVDGHIDPETLAATNDPRVSATHHRIPDYRTAHGSRL